MTNEAFQQLLQGGVVLLDGATGTNLQQAGMPIGVCPEQWILENRDVMIDLQRRFVEAGSQILYAPTFTGNRLKLAEYGSMTGSSPSIRAWSLSPKKRPRGKPWLPAT